MTDEIGALSNRESDVAEQPDRRPSDIVFDLPTKPNPVARQPEIDAAAEREGRLDSLAAHIVKNHSKSLERVAAAAVAIAKARKLFKPGRDKAWAAWCKEKLNLKPSRVRELLNIGESGDPEVALAELRQRTAARVKNWRAAKAKANLDSALQSEQAPAVYQGDPPPDAGASADSESSASSEPETPLCNGDPASARETERAALIHWAEKAQIDNVKALLARAQELEAGALPPTEA